MKNLIFTILIIVVVAGCAGRPPAPINNYGNDRSRQSSNTSRSSSRRPPLPGQKPKSNQQAQTITIEKPSITSGTNKTLDGNEVFKKSNSAVFMIYTSTGYEGFQGSGFFISADGLAVSNYHVFEGTGIGLETIKLFNDRELKVKDVILKDKENDIIVFTVKNPNNTKFNFIPLSSRNPQVGDKVYAIGSPRGLQNTFTSGEISQIRGDNLIQISVPIDHGSSGGALINEYGEAIGITTAGIDDSGANLNFAVNISVVKKNLSIR